MFCERKISGTRFEQYFWMFSLEASQNNFYVFSIFQHQLGDFYFKGRRLNHKRRSGHLFKGKRNCSQNFSSYF